MKNKNILLKIGQEITAEIIDITSTGEGIAKPDNFTVFIDNTVPGDLVQAKITQIKSSYATAKLEKIINKSNDRRTQSYCPYEEICGGCSFNSLNYVKQLEYKEKTVRDALERIGGFKNLNILPIMGGREFNYRNKAQYKVGEEGTGFYAKRTHNLIAVNDCKIQSDVSNKVLKFVNQLIKEYKISIYNENKHSGLIRGILLRNNKENEVMVVLILNGKNLPHQNEIIQQLKSDPNIISAYININTAKNNTVLGKETINLFEKKPLIETLGDKKFIISPQSFFQVNPEQTEVLYHTVKEFADLKPGENLFDLYCGTGTIGMYCYEEGVQLTGVEINKEAVKDAIKNAQLNNIEKATFLAGKAEVIAPNLESKPDCIILDPPRKGCESSLLELLLDLESKRIVYVSCNPSTLARDLKILSQKYNIIKVQPVDLFPQTGHVETVVLLELKD